MKDLEKYLHDNGAKSRKLWVTVLAISILSSLGVFWAMFGWPIALYETITSSIVTLAIAFVGINATRAALPAAAAMLNRRGREQGENTL
tara:strand:+ start:269 stop:535 length:267 start_codon:yes stop_codon:yes gene_type:complete